MSSTDAFNLCRTKRPCTNPNMAFIAQLNQWWKRLFDSAFESIKKEPRVFLINSH
jgi:hypothetical protein